MSPKEKAQGATNTKGLPTNTIGVHFGTAACSSKARVRMQVKITMGGHCLCRQELSAGGPRCFPECWGHGPTFPTSGQGYCHLPQIGGAL
jgi:hypothetical protein